MTSPRWRANPQVISIQQTRHSALLIGPNHIARNAIETVGCPSQYDGRRGAYMVPRKRVDDIAAAIELDGHIVQMQLAAW